ncbi:MAG: DUF2452 domain-containing protein [Pseudomonadota bacterium]
MGDLTKKTNSSVAEHAAVNTDGKGLNGFMLDWYETTPRGVVVKPRRQVLSEFFTSMLVLSANFKYRPVVGVSNYLYLIDDQWSLSLIAPDEWSAERQAGYVGRCELQRDMTWTIDPSDNLADDGVVADGVRRFYQAFAETLDTDLTIEEILPFYVARMPYYQRLYASAMSRSVRGSVNLSGDNLHSCREWLNRLPRFERVLLPADSL